MNTPEFVALGYCSNDHLCRIPEIPGDGKIEMTEYRIQGGGPAGDAAVGAARLGLSAAFVTSVGDDMDGRLILADFAAEKVDTSAIRVRRGGRSPVACCWITPDGRRSVAWTKNNLELLKSDEIPLEMIRRAKILHLDGHHPDAAVSAARAAKAAGVLRFSAPSAAVTDYEIDAGSVAMTSGGVRFETTEKATLAKGETYVDVPASAVEAGASGNAIASAIHLMSVYPVGITQCVNPEAFSGGSDEESDEKLRERVLESYKRLPNGANAAFYEQEAMSFPNVAAAKAVGRARGIGTVDVYVSTHAGAPDEKLLGEIEAVLQKKREIAVDVEVKAPTEKTVNMSAELTAEQGWTMQEITDAATAALQAYFTGERLGEAVYTAKLANILYGVEGVKNCHLLTPSADVSVSATELPVLGTVTITEIGAGEA